MLTLDAFLDALRRFKLVDSEQLSILESDQSSISSRELARDLIAKDLLTPYQVNQLFAGKGEDLLLGSFVLLERLGEGGMGQVFKARNWKLDHIVALKMIREDRLDSPDTIRRFQREIQAVSQLTHPNIVHALDAEESNGKWFLAMELVEGVDLKKKVSQSGPLTVSAACEAIWQAALGLQHAHEQGLVHRDIKPSNLLVTDSQKNYPHGQIKILDLGLARFTSDSEASTLTIEGTIMGTPDYLAPEQAEESSTADIRADIYSLGCSLYHLLTGEPPFPGGSFAKKIRLHMTREPAPIEQRRSDVPKEVGDVIRKMMRKVPEQRYQTPWELAQALELAVIPKATPVALKKKPVSPFADLDESETLEKPPEQRTGRGWILLGSLILLAILGGATWWLMNRSPETIKDPVTAPQMTKREQAEKDLDLFLKRAQEKGTSTQSLRSEIIEFRQRHFAFPDLTTRAALLLSRHVDSPLDKHKPIRSLARDVKLVQILGEERWRSWNGVTDLAVRRDRKHVACATYSGFQIWNAEGQLIHFESTLGEIGKIDFSPTGDILATGSGSGTLTLFETKTYRKIAELKSLAASIHSLAFSPDGKLILVSGVKRPGNNPPGVFHLIDVAQGRSIKQWEHPTGGAHDLAFFSTGKRVLAAHADGGVRIWDLETSKAEKTLTEPTARRNVRVVVLTPDESKVIWGGDESWLYVHDRKTGKTRSVSSELNQIYTISCSPDGKQVLVGCRGRFNSFLFELSSLRLLKKSPPHPTNMVSATAYLNEKIAISGDHWGTMMLWDVQTGKRLETVGHQVSLISGLLFDQDRKALTGGWDLQLIQWDLETGTVQHSLPLANPIRRVSVSPGNRQIAISDEGTGWFWTDARIFPEKRKQLTDAGIALRSLDFSPSGETLLASGNREGRLQIYSTKTLRILRSFSRKDDPFQTSAFSPDGSDFVAGTFTGKLLQGREMKELSDPQSTSISRIVFHPRGRFFASSGENGSIWMREAETGKAVQKETSHRGRVDGLCFSPDGRLMASSCINGEVRIWQCSHYGSEIKLRTLFRLPGKVGDLCFALDSRHLLTTNHNGTAYLLRLK